MKLRLTIIFLASAALTAAVPRAAHAQVDVNVSADMPGIQIHAVADFYQPLADYGSWVDVSPYGRCFHPSDVPEDWEPYTVGSWEWTDSGWYWDSDEPWGWACCHYGSWYDAPSIGWVWIPGTDWAPAWVDWRDSDDYIGWAPCGPDRSVLAPQFFTFCDIHHFHDHFRGGGGGVLIRNNINIINRTRVVNDFSRHTADIGGRQETIFVNRGPEVNRIEHATGQKFTPRPVGEVFRQSRHQEKNMRGNENRPPEDRNGARNSEQRQNTPPPTGREQQRNYQQQTPGQRPNNISPTGREQQRNYQQQQQERNLQQRPEQRTPREQGPNTISPTGREQQRNYEQQQRQQQTPTERNLQQQRTFQEQHHQTPEQRPNAISPTGREQQRNYQQPTPAVPQTPRERPGMTPSTPRGHETPTPTPPAEQHREMPTPQRPEATPNRPLPPTGREEARPEQRQVAPSAPAREMPATPQTPHDGRDRNRPDGQ